VDLPGYGYAKRSKGERRAWAELIEGYLIGRPTLRAVAALFDLRRGPEEEELELLELLKTENAQRPAVQRILVGTKMDKLVASKRKLEIDKVRRVAPGRIWPTSVNDTDSTAALWIHICKTLSVMPNSSDNTKVAESSEENAP
jgi:GTP-binding protein